MSSEQPTVIESKDVGSKEIDSHPVDTKEGLGKQDTDSSSGREPVPEEAEPKKPWWNIFLVPGSAAQIVSAALVAIGLGIIVTTQVDEVPVAATTLVGIPGQLWLRALKAVVLPLIICAMILAMQRLREMASGSGRKLALWTVGYYVVTTLFSIFMSCIMASLVWGPQFRVIDISQLNISDAEKAAAEEREKSAKENPPHIVVESLFFSLIPQNLFYSLSNDELLAILITAVIIGYLIKDSNSVFLKLVVEIEAIVMSMINWLIKVAPIGVFFLILPNLMKLPLSEVGVNLGLLIGGTLGTMAIHVFIVLPTIFFIFVRKNPYAFWIRIAPAWITAWGSASSAATLPVTLRCAWAQKIPITVYKFTCPLGCLINMDGTAIYFPMAVVFLATTQGEKLAPTDYVIICLLATLASIGTTPIPSASLVLIVMIADSVGVEAGGVFAIIYAIDWLLDRFRTAINISGDLFGSAVIQKLTGITDPEGMVDETMMTQRVAHVDQRV